MVNIFESLKKLFGKIFQAPAAKKDKEFCPHCRVPEETLKILKGEEKKKIE
ncbi:MAG: hypothetical protein Q8N65_01130 [bacterium]|nr:hypothetical protein [bacterium]